MLNYKTKTMKLFLKGCVAVAVATLFIFAPKSANAQFGVKGGVYLSNFSEVKSFNVKNNVGFQAGVAYKLKLWNAAIQPELLYVSRSANLEVCDKTPIGAEGGKYSLSYLQLPVSLQYGVNLVVARPFVQVVPYLNYALGKSADVKWNDINRLSGGIGLGAGVDVWKLQFNIRYNWDISKIGDGKEATSKLSYKEWQASKAKGFEFSLALFF